MVWGIFYVYPNPNPKTRGRMLPFIQLVVSRLPGGVRIIALPFAAVVGTIGYILEQQLASKPKDIPYLNTSIQEQREQRLLQEAMRVENLADEKLRMVPNSLKLNTGRSSRD
ncbi:hypothetical protein QR680_005146 [Steinernema hermaphroditum]|uniref:Uncharacterized protein n=1 Tax=Steinernema hermaphroditum TaxID=289476 RepID=A0AA39HR02_9BILA|nr:hypothetical protein QR680_005146 [Steinernema hermaphroditum]